MQTTKTDTSFTVHPVTDNSDVEQFRRLPFRIYHNDPHWIPHLRQDIEEVFDPKQNTFFSHGAAQRWLLRDASNNVVGRVAAFVNERNAHTFQQSTGGMGFFECIDNQEAAFVLFDQCKEWLEARGMEAMDGPINFGERNKYWGLITDNFESSPYYGQNYNPKYYVKFFENYGYKVYFNQLIFNRSFHKPLPPIYERHCRRLHEQGHVSIRHYEKSKSLEYARYFMEIYNSAWQTHDNFKEMTEEQALALLKRIKPIVDPDVLMFAFYEGKPAAFMIALPNVNELWKKVGDNKNWLGLLKFLYYKTVSPPKSVYGVAFGVKPEFQNRGLEGLFFEDILNRVAATPNYKYDSYIVTWIGDWNPKMLKLMEALGCQHIRTMATYRKLFDEQATFERAPIITPKRASRTS